MSNVKTGDLCVIVNSIYGNSGKLVLVLGESIGNSLPPGSRCIDSQGRMWRKVGAGRCWDVEAMGSLINKDIGPCRICPVGEEFLKPIRPHGDDEQDESKAWLPPVPVTPSAPCRHKTHTPEHS